MGFKGFFGGIFFLVTFDLISSYIIFKTKGNGRVCEDVQVKDSAKLIFTG